MNKERRDGMGESGIKRRYRQIKCMLRGGILILICYHFRSPECKQMIEEDILAYSRKSLTKLSMLELISEDSKRPFRNILYYRFCRDNCKRKMLRICQTCLKPLPTIEIGGEIDGGLKIIHNYCVVSVKKAGKNLTVLQGVTIGKNIDGGHPTIGDNVTVYSNSVIFGDINIGNGVMIGAGAVVNKSIPDNMVAVGNPVKIMPKE